MKTIAKQASTLIDLVPSEATMVNAIEERKRKQLVKIRKVAHIIKVKKVAIKQMTANIRMEQIAKESDPLNQE